jgi:Autographiviridae endonuclease VII
MGHHYISRIDETNRMAYCSGCGETVPVNRNAARSKGWVCAVKAREDAGLHRQNHQAKIAKTNKAWREANKDRLRSYQLQRLYGITIEEYRAEVTRRSGRCDICGKVPSGNGPNGMTLCVEHDHVTKRIRGYADRDCNTMIGAAGEDPVRLAQGIIYLKPSRDQLAAIIKMLEEASGIQQAADR